MLPILQWDSQELWACVWLIVATSPHRQLRKKYEFVLRSCQLFIEGYNLLCVTQLQLRGEEPDLSINRSRAAHEIVENVAVAGVIETSKLSSAVAISVSLPTSQPFRAQRPAQGPSRETRPQLEE